MQIENHILESFTINYPLTRIAALDQFLFVDIETTGFTAKSSSLYLIGTAFYRDGNCHAHKAYGGRSYRLYA